MKQAKRQCAIYTRTSTEEGLSQDFNSLHAQAEAGQAFIRSQASEGWLAAKRVYEDGGYSGGSMDRPALRELLDDVKAGRIDVIVVYKVDRLTRSLADFAKIVEILDEAGASFVSVTQSFNTTTSMGRLTLNILLSFAQFEREVTGERIRDKFAASKAKGIFMGGTPPLGYDLGVRSLIVKAWTAPPASVENAGGFWTWESWRRTAELSGGPVLRRSGYLKDYRVHLHASEATTWPSQVRSVGLLLWCLLRKDASLPSQWNVRGLERDVASAIGREVEHLAVSSSTLELLEACILPRSLETLLIPSQKTLFGIQEITFDTEMSFEPPVLADLNFLYDKIADIQKELTLGQITVLGHRPRQLVPVRIAQIAKSFHDSEEDAQEEE